MRYVFACLFLLLGCERPCIDGRGETVTREPAVDGFEGVSLEADGIVRVTQGDTTQVKITAQRNLMSRLEVFVRNNRLVIRDEDGRCYDSSAGLTYEVTMPRLSNAEVSGSGEIHGIGNLDTPSLDLEVSGSGDMSFDVTTQRIATEISGAGTVQLRGQATYHDLEISGSGKVSSYDLKTRETTAEISGSGDAYVFATDSLDADISGSGTVRYMGSPRVNADVSGSGEVEPR